MIKAALLEYKSGAIALVWFPYSLHNYSLNRIINCASIHYVCTFKTQEFRTKDFIVRRGHSIEHQKCKYSIRQNHRRGQRIGYNLKFYDRFGINKK